jgi:hypothetical protein
VRVAHQMAVGLRPVVLSLYHALDITFGGAAIKIVENHLGARYVRASQMITIPMGVQPAQPGQPPAQPVPLAPGAPQPPQPNRAERRRRQRAAKKGAR